MTFDLPDPYNPQHEEAGAAHLMTKINTQQLAANWHHLIALKLIGRTSLPKYLHVVNWYANYRGQGVPQLP